MNSKKKGSSFENLLAKMLLEATGFDKSHCYRTPGSGGHMQYSKGQPGDLFISDDLFARFPYVVEAKHNRTWKPGVMLAPRAQERDWLDHLLADTERGRDEAKPMLIMRGNGTKIYAAQFLLDYKRLKLPLPCFLLFWHDGCRWIMTEFDHLLAGHFATGGSGMHLA